MAKLSHEDGLGLDVVDVAAIEVVGTLSLLREPRLDYSNARGG